jgi:hypothetical protein
MLTLLEEFDDLRLSKAAVLPKRIVFSVIDELQSRRGFDGFWGDLDKDIQEEILSALVEVVEQELRKK